MKKICSMVLCLSVLLSFCSCAQIQKEQKYTDTSFDYFDTVVTVTAYDASQKLFAEHYEAFTELLGEYDKLYDIYHSYDGINNIKTINDNAGISPVEVDSRIIDLLEFGRSAYDISAGKVNICMGSVLKLWHAYREEDNNALPSMEELRAANEHTAIETLELTETTAYLKDSEASLDVGAVAKGFAAEKLCAYAKENLWRSAVISIGGNVVTFGDKEGENWNIAVENPDEKSNDYLETLSVKNCAVVTSADTQRYYMVDGKKYCHIIDPKTLMPAEYMHSVTVICDSALGDLLSTALFNMPINEGIALIEQYSDVEALFVDMDYNKVMTSGFKKYVSNDGV